MLLYMVEESHTDVACVRRLKIVEVEVWRPGDGHGLLACILAVL